MIYSGPKTAIEWTVKLVNKANIFLMLYINCRKLDITYLLFSILKLWLPSISDVPFSPALEWVTAKIRNVPDACLAINDLHNCSHSFVLINWLDTKWTAQIRCKAQQTIQGGGISKYSCGIILQFAILIFYVTFLQKKHDRHPIACEGELWDVVMN